MAALWRQSFLLRHDLDRRLVLWFSGSKRGTVRISSRRPQAFSPRRRAPSLFDCRPRAGHGFLEWRRVELVGLGVSDQGHSEPLKCVPDGELFVEVSDRVGESHAQPLQKGLQGCATPPKGILISCQLSERLRDLLHDPHGLPPASARVVGPTWHEPPTHRSPELPSDATMRGHTRLPASVPGVRPAATCERLCLLTSGRHVAASMASGSRNQLVTSWPARCAWWVMSGWSGPRRRRPGRGTHSGCSPGGAPGPSQPRDLS